MSFSQQVLYKNRVAANTFEFLHSQTRVQSLFMGEGDTNTPFQSAFAFTCKSMTEKLYGYMRCHSSSYQLRNVSA